MKLRVLSCDPSGDDSPHARKKAGVWI